MKLLLDHNLPKKLGPLLTDHLVFTAHQMGWEQLTNGLLLAAAEVDGFNLLITADQNLYSQQNHRRRLISLLVLSSNNMSHIRPFLEAVLQAIDRAVPGSYEVVQLPRSPKAPFSPPLV